MKNINLFIAITCCSLFILSSCSKQLYSYRQKVPVNKSFAKVNKEIPPVSSESESVAEIETAKINPSVETKPITSTKIKIEDKALAPVIAKIQQMAPQGGSKASGIAPNLSFKSVQKQMKAINKDLHGLNSVNIDGRRWMVVGAILMLVGLIIRIITLGFLGYGISSIGFLVFVIGLIFYLLD